VQHARARTRINNTVENTRKRARKCAARVNAYDLSHDRRKPRAKRIMSLLYHLFNILSLSNTNVQDNNLCMIVTPLNIAFVHVSWSNQHPKQAQLITKTKSRRDGTDHCREIDRSLMCQKYLALRLRGCDHDVGLSLARDPRGLRDRERSRALALYLITR